MEERASDRDAVRETSSVRPLTETELRTVARDDVIRHGVIAAFDDPNAEAILDTAVEMMEAFQLGDSSHWLYLRAVHKLKDSEGVLENSKRRRVSRISG